MSKHIDFECRPVLKDVLCAFGEKCFHNTHYICETMEGDCLPSDACPFNALVNNLIILSITPTNGCVKITGTYDIFVWYRFNNQRMIGQVQRLGVPFNVQVPIFEIEGGCNPIICEDGNTLGTQICAVNTRLEVVEAVLESDARKDHQEACPGCPSRLRVVIEKVFQAFEHGPQVVCLPVCAPGNCPAPTAGPVGPCPPFVGPTKCSYPCREDEVFKPDNCDQCPPPTDSSHSRHDHGCGAETLAVAAEEEE
ncbi:hypothetical protein RDV78_04175 [Bacillota bacterium LX-D]|nr:hypothetical protein [Bacillota bacterium LX-D]